MSTTEIHPKVEKIRQGIHQNLKKVFCFGKFNHDLSLFDGKTILQIASGATHYLILTAEHELYAVGSNNMGQLGQVLSIEKEEKPARMNIPEEYLIDPINEKIMKLSTKGWHNLVLLNTGRVFVNGSNRYVSF
jgi:alpha-tubulin suppressor-like RCC1 family protein